MQSKKWLCGEIEGHAVYEVWNKLEGKGYYNSSKLILIETTPGLFRPLYQLLDRERRMVRLNLKIEGARIAIAAQPRHGSSAHMQELVLDIDPKRGVESPTSKDRSR